MADHGERGVSHWNYRMFCRDIPDGVGGTEQEWTIREAFYDERDTRPHSWTEESARAYGDSKIALMEDVTLMAAAIASPVLYLSDDGSAIVAEEVRRGSLRR